METDRIKEALRNFMEDKTKLPVAGNSLLVYHKGKEVFRHYTGSVKQETLFRIYSMTKLLTVVSALQLYELGLYAMDDPLYEYIPEYKDITVWDPEKNAAVPAKNEIRIRDLFCMSSGLTYEGDWGETPRQLKAIREELEKAYPGEGFTTLQYAKACAKAALAFEPGTHWSYGLSHDVLGALVEVLSGKLLGEYMQENIFDPLGMKHTFFRCPAEEWKNLAEHTASWAEDAKYKESARYEAGGGGLLSTLDDYMTFARTLANGGVSDQGVRILGRKTIDLMRSDQLSEVLKQDFNWDYLKGYSYGLGVRTLVSPAEAGIPGTVGEFGWCGVLGTWVLIDPAEELVAVYMHQRYPNLEKYVQRHLRPMIYALI